MSGRVALLCLVACGSPAPATVAPAAPAPAAPAPAPAPSSALDDVFRGYVQKLPEPASLSEANGASLECAPNRWETYTHLYGLAERLPIKSDADLVVLVPWAHHADPCIRDLAIEAIVNRIKFDRNALSAPGMHSPEDHLFHAIMRALRTFLVAHQVVVPPSLFAGMFLEVTPKDLAVFRGSWVEDIGTSKNFQFLVDIDANELRVTRHTVHPDPKWPDHTETSPLTNVTVDSHGAFVIPWTATDTYSILPVGKNVVWFGEGNGYWNQMRRR